MPICLRTLPQIFVRKPLFGFSEEEVVTPNLLHRQQKNYFRTKKSVSLSGFLNACRPPRITGSASPEKHGTVYPLVNIICWLRV